MLSQGTQSKMGQRQVRQRVGRPGEATVAGLATQDEVDGILGMWNG